MNRPFKVLYPVVPIIALVAVITLFLCVLVYNISVTIWVVLVYAVAAIYFFSYGRKNLRPYEEEFELDNGNW